MKRVFAPIVVLLASALCLFAADTWKGSISDKMCGAKHMMAGVGDAECTTSCVKKGSPYVFVVGDKVYDIENQKDDKVSADLAKHAGQSVEVKGSMSKDGKSVKITSIKVPETK